MSPTRALRSVVPLLAESESPRLYQTLGPLAAGVVLGTYLLTMTLMHGVMGQPFVPTGVTSAGASLGTLAALALMRRNHALAGTRLLLVSVLLDTVIDIFLGPTAFDPVMVFIPNVLVGACLLLGARDAIIAGVVFVVAIPLSVPWRALAAAGYPFDAVGGVVMTELACVGALMLVIISRHTILSLAHRAEHLAQHLSQVIERAPDGIIVMDEQGVVRRANRAAERNLAPHALAAGVSLPALLLRFDGASCDASDLRRACDGLVRAYVRDSGRDLAITGAPLDLPDCPGALELIIRDVSPRARDVREAREDSPSPTRVGARHVLVVEDEGAVREMLVRQLQRSGWSVTACAGGHDALVELERRGRDFDVLLSDVRMPGMDGGELARRARALRPSLPIVLMSGDTGGLTDDLQLPGRAWLALPKPFDGDELARTLDAATGTSTSTHATGAPRATR